MQPAEEQRRAGVRRRRDNQRSSVGIFGNLVESIRMTFSAMSGGNQRYLHDKLGLAPDEDFNDITAGTLWSEPSRSDDLAALGLQVVGLFTGHLVAQTGVHAMFGTTTTGRFVTNTLEGHDTPLSFESGAGYRIEDTNTTTKETVMGPTGRRETGKILSLKQGEQEIFQIFCPESKASHYVGWS